ncbi:MAG: leucine-rich repeat protein [Salinivirgaceae bacterium]|nr:leucine-rich repeat protein [Salinivirgaceae bacterium]
MKRIFTILFATMLVGQAWADDFTIGNLKYTITDAENHEVSVSKAETKPIDTLAIPSKVKNGDITYTVTSISKGGFSSCTGLTFVNIPNSITTISNGAFLGCIKTVSIIVPKSVTNMGSDAFYDCDKVTIYCEAKSQSTDWDSNWNRNGGKIVWNVQIGENADFEYSFNTSSDGNKAILKKYKGNAESVSMPSAVFADSAVYQVVSIGKEAFIGCESIKTANLPETISYIGEQAFKNCTALENINIPDSVTIIRDATFYGCSSLKSIAFGKSVNQIGMSAFEKSGLEIVVVPKSIEKIDNFAFANCENLKLVYIPETVVKNEANAFADCTNTTIYCASASQPETWSDMWNEDGGAVVWGYSVPDVKTLALSFETTPNGTATITGCNDVSTIDIPIMVMIDSSAYIITGIDDNALYDIVHRKYGDSINVDNGNLILSTEGGVLYNKDKTTLIACPRGKTGTVTIPNTVTTISEFAFGSCEKLQAVEIPNSVTSIEDGAFSACLSLKSITIPNSVTSIGGAAFGGCIGITEITIPKSVVCMDAQIFETFIEEIDTIITITVYCEVSKQPEGWDERWNYCMNVSNTKVNLNVVWAKEEDHTVVAESAANAINIYAYGNTIIVENATDEILVYNAMGALVCKEAIHRISTTITVNNPGVYIVKTGSTVKRVMVN